jgi:N-acetylneuraminate synthase/N,N'-diacetyllegionaminate synthase
MVFIIAEIGINHDGNMNLAHELIRQAAICGADAAKFQAYSVDALFGPDGTDTNDEIYKGVKPLEFNKEQFAQLKKWCDEEDIEFMCSVFDEERFQWMEDLGIKRHKIASRTSKLTRDLAEKMVQTGKICYMSLGFDALPLDPKYTNVQYLYCVAKYPTEKSELNLPATFGSYSCYQGFSDHTLGIEASLVAVGRGAKIIEKHFTLDKSAKGFDHICSVTPVELADLVKYARLMEKVAAVSR